jgi:hypothetical protein
MFALLRSTMLDLDGPATAKEVAAEVHWDQHAATHGITMVRSGGKLEFALCFACHLPSKFRAFVFAAGQRTCL